MKRYLLYATVAAAIFGAGAGLWSLAAFAQGAPTPFAIFWNITGTPPYVAVSTANPLPVTPIGGSGAPATVNITQVAGATVPAVGTGVLPVTPAPTAIAAAGITPVVSASAEGSHVLQNSANHNLYDLYVTTGSTSGYLMVFNATSAPGDGAVTPVDCIAAPANATTSLFTNGAPPEVFATGITVVFSSTGCFTKTVSATAFFHGRSV